MGKGDDGEEIRVRVPARIDFAGGWSDVPHFSAREGGAVLNAAIVPCVEGSARWDGRQLHLEYTLDLPPGSHLGSSGSIDVAWLALTNGITGQQQSRIELAETAYRVEKALGIAGGKQDQYAAALGGFNLLRFGTEDQPASVETLDVARETIRALEERLLLCYSGPPGGADTTHRKVWERYGQGDEEVAAALRAIRDSALRARDALLEGDLEVLADLLLLNREQTRRLHPDTITERMDELFSAGQEAGALGSKPCGAGGGGCLVFLCPEGGKRHVEEALHAHDGDMIEFHFMADAPL